MSRRRVPILLATLLGATSALAQGAPPRTAPVVPPSASPAPAVPPASAVALCRDGVFVIAPRTISECEAHGGVKIVMPTPRQTPAAPAAPSVESRAAERPAAVADAPPAGATMRCRDGTYVTGPPSAARCASNGGVAVTLPPAPRPPNAPVRP